jgi:pseudouridine synthase
MRLNKYLSEHTLLSRRKADVAIADGRVAVNDNMPQVGQQVTPEDSVTLDGREVNQSNGTEKLITVLLNKPVGFVCSKNGQGSRTIYSLLPKEYQRLNIAGRLDKDSSGLVILTNDGELLNELTHPSNNKKKVYEVTTDKELDENDTEALITGVDIGEKSLSKFESIKKESKNSYEVVLTEGRNRQIRKMLNKRHVSVESLYRKSVDTHTCDGIGERKWIIAS